MSDTLETIIYIDDEEDILQLTKMSLEAVGGYSVHTCSNGHEGIKLAQEVQPDLIMIDVMMPEIDGPTTYGEIKKIDSLSKVPVVFMTARIQPEEVQQYLALGAVDVIAKPFDPMALADQVKEAWNNRN